MKLYTTLLLAGLLAVSAIAQDVFSDQQPSGPPDKEKVSYALGMRIGLQLKRAGAEVDSHMIAKAIEDVVAGKPTELQESEIRPLLMQAQAYDVAKKSEKNKAAAEAFLAKNASASNVTVLPDGLQYRVLQAGNGEPPKKTELLNINLRGSFMDGKEFAHQDNLQIPFQACPKGCQEALKLMKIGSKWQIFVAPELAYAYESRRDPATETGLVYEIELLSAESESAHPGEHRGRGRLGHPLDEVFFPPKPIPPGSQPNRDAMNAPQPVTGK